MMALDIRAILEHLPHRYPMLLVDRVLEVEPGKRIVAIKNVTINEPFFNGHFPHLPVMPGVLQIEALAQAAGILSFQTMGRVSDDRSVYYFVGIDGARFKRPVVPGDQLRLEVEILKVARSIWKYSGRALVDGQVSAEAELMCTLRDIEPPAVRPAAAEGPAEGSPVGNGSDGSGQ
jgi:3-hydroxyacyl-[acyl-carrier-protein] dehydratase